MIKQENIQQAIKDLTIVKSLPMLHGLLNSQLDMAIEALQFQQELVRCKDCALKPYGNRCEHWSSDVSWFGKYVEDDDYCSQGIRRDEE